MLERARLGEVLKEPEKWDWRLALYLPAAREAWSCESVAFLEDPDDVESDELDADPESVVEAGCRYVLSLQDVRGVVGHARLQSAVLSEEMLLEALVHYIDHDAFLGG